MLALIPVYLIKCQISLTTIIDPKNDRYSDPYDNVNDNDSDNYEDKIIMNIKIKMRIKKIKQQGNVNNDILDDYLFCICLRNTQFYLLFFIFINYYNFIINSNN